MPQPWDETEDEFASRIFKTETRRPLRVMYTNHRGETEIRMITPTGVKFGTTPHHDVPQWLMDCYDHDRKAPRTYALAQCCFVTPHNIHQHADDMTALNLRFGGTVI